MKIQMAFSAVLGVYILNDVLNFFGVYGIFPNVDIPMHLLGGFTMTLVGIALYQKGIKKHKVPKWFAFLFVIGFGVLIGVCWELHEWFLDHTIHSWRHQAFNQSSNDDTMKDLLDDLIGALTAYGFFFKKI